MHLYTLPGLTDQIHRGRWDATDLADRLAPLESPLRLGALLTPLHGAVFRRREGKQRLIFVPLRTGEGAWHLVLVAVMDRRTGDQQHGPYRELLDHTQRARKRYLELLDTTQPELVAGSTHRPPVAMPDLPPELHLWAREMRELSSSLEDVIPPTPGAITFGQLDAHQREMLDGPLRTSTPRFLTGRAGSSKSTLLHHQFARYAATALEQADDLTPRFVTRSEHLLRDAREKVTTILLEEHGYAVLAPDVVPAVRSWMSTTSGLMRDLVLRAGASADEWRAEDHVSTARFRELYTGRRASGRPLASKAHCFTDHQTQDRVHWTTAWFVIRALIRGHDPAEELDPDAYEELPARSRVVTDAQFEQVHEKVHTAWYSPLLTERGRWDDQSLARAAIRHPHTDLRITGLVCDEAQDLSRVELLALLGATELLRYDLGREAITCLPFVFAGDESQTLDLTGFRWASITSGFYELTGAAFGSVGSRRIEDEQLERNYRSAYEIVEAANAIQRLRTERYSESGAQPQLAHRPPSQRPIHLVDRDGAPRSALVDTLRVSNVILACDEGAEHDVVLADPVLRDAMALRAPEWVEDGQGVAPVYTAQALKGLEVDEAVLYGWGDELLSDSHRPELAQRTSYARWYVAVTRAMQQLTVIETTTGRKLWDDLDLPEEILEEHLLEHVHDTEAQLRARADEARQRGMEARRAEELFRARQDYRTLGDQDAATEAAAFGHRFSGEHGEAAELFLQLGRTDEAVTELWRAHDWPRLAELASDADPVRVARLLTQPANPAAVEPGRSALIHCHAQATAEGEPLDLVDALASVVDQGLRAGWQTTDQLLDALADEPLLARGRRDGAAGLVADAVAVDLDVDTLADGVRERYDHRPRLVLCRWMTTRPSWDDADRERFVDALRAGADDTAAALAAHLGLTEATAPPSLPAASQRGRRSTSSRRTAPAPARTPGLQVTPGEPWTGPRGTEVWKLSKQHRKLIRKRDEATLASLVGEEPAGRFVTTALTIRPDGGKVWVDGDGVATILVDGRLTALGLLPGRGDHPAAATPRRPAGQSGQPRKAPARPPSPSHRDAPAIRLPEVDGWPPGSRRYLLHRRDISDATTGTTLSSVIGTTAAAEVASRLLQHRPSGGRIYVAPDGRVVTRPKDRYLVIGAVSPQEWFGRAR